MLMGEAGTCNLANLAAEFTPGQDTEHVGMTFSALQKKRGESQTFVFADSASAFVPPQPRQPRLSPAELFVKLHFFIPHLAIRLASYYPYPYYGR